MPLYTPVPTDPGQASAGDSPQQRPHTMPDSIPHISPSMPALPPAYDFSSGRHDTPPVDTFEIDEDEVYEPAKRAGLLSRAAFVARRSYFALQDRVVDPVVSCTVPVRTAYSLAAAKLDMLLLRLGNPLVVKRLLYVSVVVVLLYAVTLGENSDGINGVSGGSFSSGKLYDVEKLGGSLRLYIDASSLKENIHYLSSFPHVAGSTGDLALARYVEAYFSNNGLDLAEFAEFDVFLNYPKKLSLRLADGSFEATLHDGSADKMHHLAFSPNSPPTQGELAAPYVYIGYGSPQDYRLLRNSKVSLRGKIALVRYGGPVPDPNKVLDATHAGAVAVVFISPQVSWAGQQTGDAISKINVGLTRYNPGDVLSPGVLSQDSKSPRLDWMASGSTAKVPCLPISYNDGEALIKVLGVGGAKLDLGYSGDDSPKLKLRVESETRSTHLIWNVLGGIRGREQAGKGIIFGAPRDSLCYGALTSASGTAVLLEIMKALTSLQRRYSWSPSRTIYFVSFDASEYNLAGSTELVENRRKKFQQEGYTYIEVSDILLGDTLQVHANPLVHDVIREEMRKVDMTVATLNGKSKITLYDLYKDQHGGRDDFSNNLLENKDYIPFVNMLNMPAIDIGFRSTEPGPKHTCADTFAAFEKGPDPSMLHHVAIVELLARIGLRLAEDPIIPFNFNTLVSHLRVYKDDLARYAEKVTKDRKVDIKFQFDGMTQSLDRLSEGSHSIEQFHKEWKSFIEGSSSLEPVMLAATRRLANDNIVAFGVHFISSEQSLLRAGYPNHLFGVPYNAPDHPDETYQWNTFPFVRDLLEQGDFGDVQKEINLLADAIRMALQMLTRLM